MPRAVSITELRAERVPLGALIRDLVRHRDLLPLLARQDFRGKYRAARLGIAWSAIQPLMRGAVLAIVFTRIVRFPMGQRVPYAAFVLAGTSVWGYLMASVTEGTTSITRNAALAGRVYFPRLFLPAMPAASGFPSYLLSLAVVVLVSLAVGIAPSVTWLLLPAAILLGTVLVIAGSLPLALMHVYYRDIGPLVAAIMGILFYATPVFYSPDLAEGARWLLDLNPFTGPVLAVRWALFGGQESLGWSVWSTLCWSVGLLVVGVVAYRRHERVCVDRL